MESGSGGYGKIKKSFQIGGGWAKHAYGDLHQLSNRRERRALNQAVRQTAGLENQVKYGKKRKKYKPTRRHILQKIEYLDREIKRLENILKSYNGSPWLEKFNVDILGFYLRHKAKALEQLGKIQKKKV